MTQTSTPEALLPARRLQEGAAALRLHRFDAALENLREAAALGDRSAVGRLHLALAEERAGDPDRAVAELRALVAGFPGWTEPALHLAASLRRRGEVAAAICLYEQALEQDPTCVAALVGLGRLRSATGPAGSAELLLLRAVGLAPLDPDAWDALGMSLRPTDPGAAEAAFARGQALAPTRIGIALRRIDAARAAGHAEAELARLEAVGRTAPRDTVALTARGALLDNLGRFAEAAEVLEAAALLAPDCIVTARLCGVALAHAQRLDEASAELARAHALAPDDAEIVNNLAATLMRRQYFHAASGILERLLAEQGERPVLLANLANALVSRGLQTAGLAAARRAVLASPQDALGHRAVCNALPYVAGVDAAGLLGAARAAAAVLARGVTPMFANTPDPERPLRIGLLSLAFKTHPVGWLTIAGLEALNPANFQLVCIGQSPSSDPLQRRFAAIAAEWVDIERIPHAEHVAALRDLGLDILIDLSGHGDRGLLALCAHRLAPVQIKWVGSQSHSTGMAEMDWFISDAAETPAGFEPFYSERLLRLPDGYVCYSPPAYAPDVAPAPALEKGFVTFGCYNNLAKITLPVIALWADILAAVPTARLRLKSPQFDEAEIVADILARFAAQGVDPARLELSGRSSHRQLLAEYAAIDIVLDPFPYSGGLTTCEALWMGVPTLTMPGQSFASRHAASHLSNVGLADWIVADEAGYRAAAIARASDSPALAALRAGMRHRVRSSPLCDGPRFATALAAALRTTWRDWCVAAVRPV